MNVRACICRPGDPEGWYREDCAVHGREAQEARACGMSADREHLCYADENGEPEECIEDCPGCHWEGNLDCEALAHGCDLCDPDGVALAKASS